MASSWQNLKTHSSPKRGGGFRQSADGQGRSRCIQNSVECGAAGFHALRELGFGNAFLRNDALQLQGDRLFHRKSFDLGKDVFLREKIPQVGTAVFVVRFCFHGMSFKYWARRFRARSISCLGAVRDFFKKPCSRMIS